MLSVGSKPMLRDKKGMQKSSFPLASLSLDTVLVRNMNRDSQTRAGEE